MTFIEDKAINSKLTAKIYLDNETNKIIIGLDHFAVEEEVMMHADTFVDLGKYFHDFCKRAEKIQNDKNL